MSAKSMFFKLVFALIALVGWLIYDRWDDITYNIAKAQHNVVKTAKKALPKEDAPVVQTYKWTDADGKVHYSNIKPADAGNVETKAVNTGQNVMPSVSKYDVPRKKEENKSGGLLGHLPQAVHDAKALEQQMQNRSQQLDQQMKEIQ